MNKMSRTECDKLDYEKTKQTHQLIYKKRIESYNYNPKLCLRCNIPLKYEKRMNIFCNQSFSAIFHNFKRHKERKNSTVVTTYLKYSKKESKCLFCNNNIVAYKERKFCS